ncbi:TIGR04076 family protein [Gorillibacterium sp. sgz500922]|uniref:TIGR04076 family protein n=1 Tax=Gorillibacterium sp. sgz500922 TaxID=3446694 RepID=UPI003F673FB8
MAYEFEVKVTGVKGHCRAGHKEGEVLKVSTLNAGPLCGTAYHAIFPMMLALNMGAKLPWDPEGNTVYSACPDVRNQMSMEIRRIEVPDAGGRPPFAQAHS